MPIKVVGPASRERPRGRGRAGTGVRSTDHTQVVSEELNKLYTVCKNVPFRLWGDRSVRLGPSRGPYHGILERFCVPNHVFVYKLSSLLTVQL